ncbi:MAG: Crp/Fnr family transcriptional regulator, partial [Myxococcota bacterium]
DESGNTVILSMAEPGDTLGYRAFFADEAYRASAEALTDARVCFIDRETVRALLERNPKVGQRFLGHIARDVIQSEDQRFLMSTQKVRPRLAHLLLALRDRHASVDDSGRLEFELPYSRQDLAAHLGARPETIARTIKRMDDDGVAQFSGRRVVVDDLDRLLDEVELAV